MALGSLSLKNLEKEALSWKSGRTDKGLATWTLKIKIHWRDESETRRFQATVAADGKIDVRPLD